MKKEIPLKNYVVLAVVVILTVLATFYARNWYITVKQYNAINSPTLNVINEINVEEISNYTLENPKFVIYVSSGVDDSNKNFEKNFKKYIISKNLEDSILYINVDNVNAENLNAEFKKYATSDMREKVNVNSTSMYIFDNGRITNVILDVDNLNNKQIDKLFKKYKVADNA